MFYTSDNVLIPIAVCCHYVDRRSIEDYDGGTMKVVFITKQGWLILLAACVFIIGNCLLLYRFLNKASIAENEKLRQLAERYFENDYVRGGRLSELAAAVRVLKKRPTKSRTRLNESETPLHDSTLPLDEKKERLVLIKDAQERTKKSSIKFKVTARTSKEKQSVTTVLSSSAANDFVAAIVVIACNRPTVKRCLDLLLKYRPSAKQFPIIVSQDCGHQETADVIASYKDQVTHIKQPDLSNVQGVPGNMLSMMGYYKISRHYKWALGQAFDHLSYDTVIVVEDDLDIGKFCKHHFVSLQSMHIFWLRESFFLMFLPGKGEGGSHVAHLNFKTSRVGVYKCLWLIVSFAITVTIWPRRLSLVAISFHSLSLLFGQCSLSEFTLAGPL